MRTILFLLFILSLSLSTGCSKSSKDAIQKNSGGPTTTLEKLSRNSNLSKISPEEVIELHKAMFEEVDRLSADDQLQFIDLKNAKIIPLFVTELHPVSLLPQINSMRLYVYLQQIKMENYTLDFAKRNVCKLMFMT